MVVTDCDTKRSNICPASNKKLKMCNVRFLRVSAGFSDNLSLTDHMVQTTTRNGICRGFPYHNGFNASSTRESPHLVQNHNVQPTTHNVGENNAQMSGFDTHQEKNIGQNQLNSVIDDCWDDLMRPPSPLVRSSFINIS